MVVAVTSQLLAATDAGRVIPLSNGITTIDLTGQQSESMIILANRENFNAHGFDVLSIYVKPDKTLADAPIWHIVPVFDDDKERLTLTVAGGADCTLHDFRLVQDSKNNPLRLVTADRSLGDEGFTEPNVVTFSFYVLRLNEHSLIGRPLYYFERTSQSEAKRKYCDVGEALKKELGLDDYRKASGARPSGE